MGLKFRRGTTAQKSGSLNFGEPYVNTTLGTLQIGGESGDITLGASGTGSQGSFAGISGSSLDITGNTKIDGNLTLGGAITIGDNTSDVVNVVASLSSSLIPSVTNAFDLGSASKIWRDLYISTGSIKFIDNGNVVGTLSTTAAGLNFGSNITIGSGSFEIGRRGTTNINTNLVMGLDVMNTDIVTGQHNIGMGSEAGASLNSGNYNIMLGYQAGRQISNAVSNVLIGQGAGNTLLTYNSIVPSFNTFVGGNAGQFMWTGQKNVALGNAALYGQTGGTNTFQNNTAIGYGTATNITGVSTNNIYIGAFAGPASSFTTQTYKFYVSNGDSDQQPYMFGNMLNVSRSLDINASLTTSGSIIPQTSNAFDLGSADKIWRDLYISTGSIKMVNPANNQVVTTINAVAGGGIQIGNVQITTASISFVDNAGIVTQTVAQSSSVGSTSNFVTTSSFNSYTGSLFQEDIYVAASGSSPVRVGKGSGFKLGNTVLGLNVLNSNTTGDNNTMIGMTAGAFNQTADDNTFVGYRAGYANQTGAQNTAVGSGALSNNNYAGNTVLGAGGLKRLATGGFNTAIGYLAGEYAISGSSNNTFIGYQTGPTSSVVVNSELYIGAQGGEASLIRGNFANSALRVNGTMHVRDGLVVSGSITATGDVVAYSTSDKRHKNTIVLISDALSKVTKLNGVTWEWNDDVNEVTKSTPKTGLIAQEVQEVLPEVVKEREDGFLALDYSKMMGLMVEAIKELSAKVEELENK